jgi:hypothetical protein
MKQLLKTGLLIFGISIILYACTNETYDDKITQVQDSHQEFSLENFDDPFIKNNLIVDLETYTSRETETGEEIREFNVLMKTEQIINVGSTLIFAKYSVIGSKKKNNNKWNYSLIKFTSDDIKQIQKVSFQENIDNTGVFYTYNQQGKLVRLEVFENGKSMATYNGINKTSKAPAISCVGEWCNGGDTGGSMVTVKITSFTDWYNVRSDGTYDYNGSTPGHTRVEQVWIPNSSNSNSSANHHEHTIAGGGHVGPVGGNTHSFEKIIDIQTKDWLNYQYALAPETPVADMEEFLDCIDVNLNAEITIYANQPKPNSSSSVDFLSADPIGHAFISIKQGTKIVTFGFYPKSKEKLGAFGGKSIIGNNGDDSFDVSMSKTINGKTLDSIVNAAKKFDNVYDINNYNCTDYALKIANLAGMNIANAWGVFPDGSGGNNPGKLGQILRSRVGSAGVNVNTSGGNAPSKNKGCH